MKRDADNGTLWGEGVCTLCGKTEFLDFFEVKNIPAQDGVLWPSRAEALNAPKGDISLSFCLNCGYAGNRLFQPDLLKFVGYNVSLEHSPLYQDFINDLASRLIEKYGLREKVILEIGCGNGFFLKTICAAGPNTGVGFDPSYVDTGGYGPDAKDVLFIKDFYSERHSQHRGDLVCCRQVIDHLGNPKAFLKMIRSLMPDRSDSVVYFEIPNPERRFQQLVPWNVGYEHGSWFFPEAFQFLFELSGFEVRDVSPCYGGEYLGLEAVPAPTSNVKAKSTRRQEILQRAEALETMSLQLGDTISTWKERLKSMESEKTRAIPWGAGERGIGFLSSLNVDRLMPFIVDINPGRIGRFLPGTGQKVVPPEFLTEYQPDVIIVTNATYQHEIRNQAKELGLRSDILVL